MLPMKLPQPRPTRRGFLTAAAATGAAFVIGFDRSGPRVALAAAGAAIHPFDAYVLIGEDDVVTVMSAHMDMGQGIYSGIATLVAEELDADWSKMQVVGAAGNESYYGNLSMGGDFQLTGGSSATPSSWDRYREAGARARAMLIGAAAEDWGVPESEITIENGTLSHPSGSQSGFGAFATKAASRRMPSEVRLKEHSSWKLIGNRDLRRLDAGPKSTGRQQFTIDVMLPGMLVATVAHPPRFGGKVRSFDAREAKRVKGVVDVVEIPRGVAVVAENSWAAIKGKRALKIEWDESAAETRGSQDLLEHYRIALEQGDAVVARQDGDADKALSRAATVIDAQFEFPYLAHAALEPMNAVARMQDGVLEVWGGHQMPTLYQQVAANLAGLPPDKVKLHVMMTGGGFGRRAVPDADVIVEAVATAKALGWRAPVKVQWTREDDMAGGRYRPIYVHRISAGLDAEGRPTGWRHRIVGQSIMGGSPFAAMIKNGVDPTSVEGASTLPYAIPDLKVDLVTTDVGVPVLWWRSVGSTHTAYSTEVMIDQLAYAAKADPVAFRRELLKDHPRHLGVLDLVAEKAGWGTPLPEGKARGVAVHESFNTFVAQIAEIAMKADGSFRVERVVCAVDCGVPINPDIIEAQMEGGIGFGLGTVLKSALHLEEGRVVETNYDTFEVLRIDGMPKVEVHIVPSRERPTGVGEPGVPPIGPALANAYFAATGRLVTTLPFTSTLSM
jgi:isoquinoline 1-oxidoreductase subunit beta